MLLSDAITTVLQRTGLSTSVDSLRDNARTYLSMATTELLSMDVPWWFLDQTATFTTAAGTRAYQPISAQVAAWYSFVDETNNRALPIVGADEYDANDLDRTETGDADYVYVAGLDGTTGYPVIEITPTPGTTGDRIRVRYRADVATYTSANDATDLSVLGLPKIAENCIIYNAASLYLLDEGDTDSAAREAARYGDALTLAIGQHRRMQGNRRFPPRRGLEERGLIRTDSSLIVSS
tara:strand:+ start:5276 stop:5986 length:711 start_codon:yes stop_codon:yes gene_type:complete